jgi:hypothetical protein
MDITPPRGVGGVICATYNILLGKNMKEKKTLDDLEKHPLVGRCFKDAIRLVIELEDSRPLTVKPSWKREPYEYEYYQLKVGSTLTTLLNACQQLTDSVLYLSSFTPSKRMKQHGVTRQRHVQYCIESYIVHAQSICDKLLVLVDAVFHLGNSNESIGYASIGTNIHVRMSGIDKELKAMNKIRNKYSYVRNEIIHHANFQEDDLRLLQGFSLVRDSMQDDRLNSQLKGFTREYIQKKIVEFNGHVALLFEHLYRTLNALDKIYQKKKRALSPNQCAQPTGKTGSRLLMLGIKSNKGVLL